VVRCFEDGNVIHVNNKVDPISDIEVIHTELALADMQSIEKAKHRFGKTLRAGDKEAMKIVPLLERVEKALDGLHPVRTMGLTADEMALLQPLQLLTSKPALYIANVGEHGFENNPLLERVKQYAAKEGAPVVAISAKLESEIAGLDDEEKKLFLEDMGMTEPGLDRLIHATYDLLGLQTYFTAGEKEVRAWTVRKGATAPQAAGVIHTDFEKGFIRAEVIAYDDYVRLGGEAKSKEAGKMRLEGKEYIVKDGDVMHFRFNV
jgi:GTP-binding protein YchF